ncbi:site-2 protease family protein [Sphingomonas sp.]|uniref:site-2 protease family protein n=1 Tax=Sphingomonas sp. TaxID=28214 RepID=UPI0031DFCA5B
MRIVAHGVLFLFGIAAYGALVAGIRTDLGILVRLPVVLLIGFVSVLFHELGHASAVTALGGRVHRIVVLPLMWDSATRRVALAPAIPGGEVGGYVSYTLDTINARRKRIWIALAGPAADAAVFLATLLALALLASAVQPSTDLAPVIMPSDGSSARLPFEAALKAAATERPINLDWLSACLTALGLTSIGAGVANLLPFQGSDGHHILRNLRRRRQSP